MSTGEIIKAAVTLAGAATGTFLGGMDGLISALVVFVVIDYITGVCAAIKRRDLSSVIGFWGILKKILIFVIVGLGVLIDKYIIGQGATLRTAAIFFYMANECLSVLENCAFLGVPIPRKFLIILGQMKENTGEENGEK